MKLDIHPVQREQLRIRVKAGLIRDLCAQGLISRTQRDALLCGPSAGRAG